MTQAPKFYWLLKDAIGADKTDILECEPTRHTIVDFVKVVDASYVEMLEAKLFKYENALMAISKGCKEFKNGCTCLQNQAQFALNEVEGM